MGGIFVSSRDDTAHSAGRLGGVLGARFGRQRVVTVDSIGAGADTLAAIRDAVADCDVLLAVIGPSWLTSTHDRGHRRIEQEDDLVAVEIATALERNTMVIPVLVEGGQVPRAIDLPERVRGLAQRRPVRLDHLTFRADAEQLLSSVESALPQAMRPRRRPQPVRRRSTRRSDRPVPVSRTIRRIALWFAIFLFASPASISLFGLIAHPTAESIGVSIATLLAQAIILTICVVALRREIGLQRRMIAHSPVGDRATAAHRAVSSGRIRLVSVICIVIAVLIGVSVATTSDAVGEPLVALYRR
jgi:hypothetical protein